MNKKELEERKAQIWGNLSEMRSKFEGKEMSAEERQQWDGLIADFEKLEADIRAEEKYQAIAKRQAEQAKPENRQSAEEMQMFRRYLLGEISAKELRDFSSTTITGLVGTNIVPKEVQSQVEIAMKAEAAIINAVDIINTNDGNELALPTVNDTSNRAEVVADYTDVDKAAPALNSVNLKALNYRTKIIPVSYGLLQDSAVNLPVLIGQLLGAQFARGYQYDMTTANSNATATMKGLIKAAQAVNGAGSAAITYADIVGTMFGVNAAYHQNAKWMLNSDTLKAIMKLTDTEGHYIFQPSLSSAVPGTILGKEYILNDDMETIGASKYVLAFGDFKKYKLRIAGGASILTLRERYADFGAIAFLGFQRADGALVDAGTHPVAVLKLAASGE